MIGAHRTITDPGHALAKVVRKSQASLATIALGTVANNPDLATHHQMELQLSIKSSDGAMVYIIMITRLLLFGNLIKKDLVSVKMPQ
jgi:hypothetical protein